MTYYIRATIEYDQEGELLREEYQVVNSNGKTFGPAKPSLDAAKSLIRELLAQERHRAPEPDGLGL